MNKKIILTVIIILLIVGAAVAIFRLLSGPEDTWFCQDGVWVKHGHPRDPMPSVICGQPQNATTTKDGGASPTSATTSATTTEATEPKTSNGHVEVTKPKAGDTVELPFSIKGQSVTFEGNVPFKIKEPSGRVLISSCFMAGAYELKPFTKLVSYFFQKPEGPDIVLEVYDDNPKGDDSTQLVRIPLKLEPKGWTTVKLFFSDSDNQTSDCGQVKPIELVVPRSGTPAKRSMELLLEGAPCGINSLNESYQGLISNIKYGVELQSLAVDDNGVARADFNEKLQVVAGDSCKIAAIKAQITQTLKQFPTIKEVIISINGQPEGILQP